jgi:hypothetical protein
MRGKPEGALPGETIHHIRVLRTLLRAGSLAGRGYVALEGGPTLPFESAVEITLLGLGDLLGDTQDVRPGEWHQLEADVEYLYKHALTPPDASPIWPEWRPPCRRELPSSA